MAITVGKYWSTSSEQTGVACVFTGSPTEGVFKPGTAGSGIHRSLAQLSLIV